MLLIDYLLVCGDRLFRWRSFSPILILPLLWLQRANFHHPLDSSLWGLVYEMVCLVVALFGVTVRIVTIGYIPRGTSGRNALGQRAETLNTTGIYSLVRNPLYVGNYLIFLGCTLMFQSWELVILNTTIFVLAYLPIILREEEFLLARFGDAYRDYVHSVPCAFPRRIQWIPPALPFDLKMVLRREQDTWMATMITFVAIEYWREYIMNHSLGVSLIWNILGSVGLAAWLILKILKKTTRLLPNRR